jgi:membrane protease subunit HflK
MINLHAPSNVHFYFRDVASSMEDKQRVMNESERYALDTIIRSKGEAEVIKNQSEAYKLEKINNSTGEATAFLSRYKAFMTSPEITRFRLYMETIENSLQNINTIFLLKFKFAPEPEFWLNTNEKTIFLPYKATEEK